MTTQAVEVFYAVGHHLIENEQFHDAAIVLRAMIVASPTDPRGWLALSQCHEEIDQLMIAKELLAAGRTVVVPDVRLGLALARRMRLVGEHGTIRDQLLDEVEEGLLRDPNEDLLRHLELERCAS